MGTRLDALIVNPNKNVSMQCWLDIEAEVSRLSKLFNKFDENSELYTINKQAAHSPLFVSDELWSVFIDCKRYHSMTLGYFDISLSNYTKVSLDSVKQTVFFQDEGIQLDLGAFGKGYALERIRNILLLNKINCALINFGNSSVLALGSHPFGDSWPIGIEDPYNPQNTLGVVELKDSTLSTSGNMPSHTKHILDPHTGVYSEVRKIVSVKASNAVDAEVLSTSLMIAPEDTITAITSSFVVDEYLLFNL
ncbi:FAD:protein FMN transferase [Dysgonomonas sp. Marseille-P4677]|nr:FAD:protein FMN transferase [Dysgonomonas sp. Marseille-P4677]